MDGGRADLVGCPVVSKVGGCDRGKFGQVAGVQDKYVPGAYCNGDLMHCLVVGDVGPEGQAVDAAAARLQRLLCLSKRGIRAADQDETFRASGSECHGRLAANTTSLDV